MQCICLIVTICMLCPLKRKTRNKGTATTTQTFLPPSQRIRANALTQEIPQPHLTPLPTTIALERESNPNIYPYLNTTLPPTVSAPIQQHRPGSLLSLVEPPTADAHSIPLPVCDPDPPPEPAYETEDNPSTLPTLPVEATPIPEDPILRQSPLSAQKANHM